MKKETLFRALTNIGDDLLLMAQQKRFPNPWRRWGKMAATIVLVICLGALVLPYLPMGCGSSSETAETETVTTTTESIKQESVTEETAEAEEKTEETVESEEVVSVWFREQRYELEKGPFELPEDLGDELGVVKASDGRDLTGCRIFSAGEETEDIYVETPEGYWYAVKAE